MNPATQINPQSLITIFPSLTEYSLRKEIADKGVVFSFAAGDVLMDYGRYISHIPIVLSGGIRILKEDPDLGKEVFLYYVKRGETCAMSLSCCSQKETSRIKAIAEDHTELVMIPVENMECWLNKYTTWKNFIFETYQKSYNKLMGYVTAISFQKLDERLLMYLQEKAAVCQCSSFHVTHQEIAQELNSSREGISRLLKKMEQENIVELGRNRIKLLVM